MFNIEMIVYWSYLQLNRTNKRAVEMISAPYSPLAAALWPVVWW